MVSDMQDLLVETGHSDFDGLQDAVYEYTDCGACIEHDNECVRIGSIVEGTDVEMEIQPELLFYPFEMEQYWQALQSVEESAREIWMDTHGCGGCRLICGNLYEVELCPVMINCPDCKGRGVII